MPLLQVIQAALQKGYAEQFPGPMESRGFETDPDKGLKQLQDPVPSSETAFQVTEALPSSNPPSNAGKPFLSNGLQKSPAVQTPPTADGTDLELVPHLEVTPAEDKNAACKPSNGLIAEPDQGAQEEGLDQDTPQPTGNGPSSAARPRSIKTKEQKEALEAAFLCKSQNNLLTCRDCHAATGIPHEDQLRMN